MLTLGSVRAEEGWRRLVGVRLGAPGLQWRPVGAEAIPTEKRPERVGKVAGRVEEDVREAIAEGIGEGGGVAGVLLPVAEGSRLGPGREKREKG